MRIMHVSNHCGKANGNVNVSVDEACIQAKNGHVVAYASCGGDFVPLMRDKYGIKIFDVPQPHRGVLPFSAVSSALTLISAIRKFRPDVVHLHMAAHNFALQPLRLFGLKVVTTVHNEFDKSVWIMGLADRVVSVSRAGAAAMIKRGVSPERSRVVLNGSVDSPRLPDRFEAKRLGAPSIISVCGLHHRKGVADLINAFAQVTKTKPTAQLYILGEGPSLAEYQALAGSLGVSDSVHFMGFLDDPRPYLYGADVFVLASHADPGPLVIAEARRAGCAVVATNVDGIPEMLDFGKAGVLVEPRQPDALAAAILNLLSHPEQLAHYRQVAKADTDRFTIHRVCRDMDKIYGEIVALSDGTEKVVAASEA